MHSYQSYALVTIYQDEALRAAKASRLQASARRAAVSQAPVAEWRQHLGFGLVEAGLRLAVGKTAHPPDRHDPAAEWSALAR